MKETTIAMLLVATVLSANTVLVFDTLQNQMDELNKQFSNVMNETLNFLDHAWNIAKKFQDPNYTYDPSELGNYTPTETPQQANSPP